MINFLLILFRIYHTFAFFFCFYIYSLFKIILFEINFSLNSKFWTSFLKKFKPWFIEGLVPFIRLSISNILYKTSYMR